MTFKEIKELITLVSDSAIKEFKLVKEDFEIKIRTDKDNPTQIITQQAVTPAVAAPAPAVAAPVPASNESAGASTSVDDSTDHLVEIKSPMVGTFYRSPSPDKPVYVQVGDTIKEGGVVCIIEAMKLFNEIESEVSGKIVKVIAEDASPVEYDQVLFLVDPQG